MSLKCARPSGSPTKTLFTPLLYPIHNTYPTYDIVFYLIIWVINKKMDKQETFPFSLASKWRVGMLLLDTDIQNSFL